MIEREALALKPGDRIVRPGASGVVVQNLGTGTIFVDWKIEGRDRVSQEMHGARRDVGTWSIAPAKSFCANPDDESLERDHL